MFQFTIYFVLIFRVATCMHQPMKKEIIYRIDSNSMNSKLTVENAALRKINILYTVGTRTPGECIVIQLQHRDTFLNNNYLQ